MIYTIPLNPIPNQTLSTTVNGKTWQITIETRLNRLYATFNDELYNRICLDRTVLIDGFFFADLDGTENPIYEGLGSRFVLVWTDEL